MGKVIFLNHRLIKSLVENMKTTICLLLVAMLAGFCLSSPQLMPPIGWGFNRVKQVANVKAAKMSHSKEMSDLKKKLILRKQRAYAMKAKRADDAMAQPPLGYHIQEGLLA